MLLSQLVPRFGERLLQAAVELDGTVVRAIPGGRLRVAAGLSSDAGLFAIQRDYEAQDGSPLVLTAVVRPGDPGELRAMEIVSGRAMAANAREEGFVFLREPPDGEACVSWGPPEGPLQEDCSAAIHRGAVVVSRSQVVGGNDTDPPHYRLRVDGGPEPSEVSALTEGIAAFAAGDVDGAGEDFTRAADANGPGSRLDMAAVRFNLAMVAEAKGDRERALAGLQAIGDATFPGMLEEAIRRLYRAGDR